MAVTLGDAVLYLKGNTDGLDKTLADAARKTRDWASGLGSQLQTLAGTAVLGGVAAVTGAVVGIGTAALGVATDVSNATNTIQAELGATQEEAERLANVAKNVWGSGFAGSIEEAGLAVARTKQILGDMPDDALQGATEDAFRLQDAFGLEVNESLDAAKTLMDNFGMSSEEAMNFLATGMQRGLNRSGDLLDTIGEYSVQMSAGGASAEQFFSLMENGLEGGMLGTDKAIDAFKEFRVRIQDGSDLTRESLEAIGIDADKMSAALASGQMTAADAFGIVQAALNETEDSTVRFQAGVGLLGTQFEDLGDGALGLSMVGTTLEDMAGATDSLNAKYNNWPAMWEGIKRSALVALEPLGTQLLEIGNRAMPLIQQGFDAFQSKIAPAIEIVANRLGSMFDAIAAGLPISDSFINALSSILMELGVGQETVIQIADSLRGFAGALAFAQEHGTTILNVLLGISAAMAALAVIGTVVGWVTSLAAAVTAATATFTAAGGGIAGLVAILGGPVTLVIAAVAAAVALLAVAWANNWGDIQGKTQAAIDFISGLLDAGMAALKTIWDAGLLALQTAMDLFALAAEGKWYEFGEKLRSIWDTAWQNLKNAVTTIGGQLKTAVSSLVEDVKRKFTDINWGQIGRDIINGIINGIKGAASGLADAARGAASNASQAIKGFFGIRSPSRLMEEYGAFVDQGLAQGMLGGRAVDAARSLSQSVAGAIAPPAALPLGAAGGFGGLGGGGAIVNINQYGNVTIANGDDNAAFMDAQAEAAARGLEEAIGSGQRRPLGTARG